MMKKPMPDTNNSPALEAWFATGGLVVETVDRCPEPACERCGKKLERAA